MCGQSKELIHSPSESLLINQILKSHDLFIYLFLCRGTLEIVMSDSLKLQK